MMCLFRLKQACAAWTQAANRNVTFKFDLFLSYCREDQDWVHQILVPELEDVHGLTCCVHFRDFPVRGQLSRVIHEFMDDSRYVLIVMSRHSVNKRWPSFELTRAQDLARTQAKTVFYVKLGDLGDDVTPEVKQVLDSEIYIEWPDDVCSAQWVDRFFERLVGAIRDEQVCGDCCGRRTFHAWLRQRDYVAVEQLEDNTNHMS